MKNYLFLCILFTSIASFAQTKEVCFTIDDLPVVNYGNNDEAYLQDITHKLIATFDAYDIPAIGFVNESKLYQQGGLSALQIELLEHWLENGYQLGNHTYSHINYHQTSFKEYTAEILKGEEVTKPLSEKYALEYNYFRHPFLRVGLTKARHDSLNHFLEQHGYQEAPVTIDNDDYLFAKAYHVSFTKKDLTMMKKIGEDYISYMEDKVEFYEKLSGQLWDRNIKHILLLHANKLNAEYLDELAEMYQRHGYAFISLQEALTDEVYKEEISRYGDWGISWIDRWALTKGKKGDFFAGDPVTPEYVQELAQ
ncbi:peptidoglycan/xylan/chitin deacetylase (PgdA/CDA1 family) [Catalinimonas alkaloidigena]|uniref:polysaccharide deacetylase family protein n=1 Tax=Catalinimonas alkaloidigena TaxID=1075417 RepID=UPI002405F1A9|nr:polysaccharide deacetylase family protein [Catalinimonas alkaloidigena]MDF9795039.1 peptidoglycan/xylan/chitin deacetylase (PgdA/CDA1 family) [Catalinimonas alkaloidigena]